MPDATSPSRSTPPDRRQWWPWLIALLIIGGLAGYWKEDLNSLKRKHAKLKKEGVEASHESSDDSVAFILAVRDALAAQGIPLTLVSMPYREDLYPDREAREADLLASPGFEANIAWTAQQRLRHAGLSTVDLWNEFYEAAQSGDIYQEDLCHLKDPVSETIGAMVYQKLNVSGALNDGQRVTVIGECFAGTFGEIFEAHAAQEEREMSFEVLRGSADRGRIPNQMFRFDEVYLENCDQVVWVVPYLIHRYDQFPPLITDPPSVGEAVEHRVTIRITKGLGMGASEMKSAVKTMPYPDALAELEFEVVKGGDGLPGVEGGKGIIVAWVAQDRARSGVEHLDTGREYYCSLYDWNAYTAAKPEIAGKLMLRPLNDFEKPRYWLQSWIRR